MKRFLHRLGGLPARIALAAAVLLAAAVPARYTNSVYGYLPVLTLGFLLLLSLSGTALLRRRVRFESDSADSVCLRGEKVPLSLRVHNPSPLTCPMARALLYVSDPRGGSASVTPTVFTLAANSDSRFDFDIRMCHIGLYRAGLQRLYLYDFLGLFRLPVRERRDLAVTVLPRPESLDAPVLRSTALTESRNLRRNTPTDGFDYTGVREYVPGDAMKRIHWKLSSHTSGYMTKITEASRRNDLTVVLDLVGPQAEDETLFCLADCIVETGLSLLLQARRQDAEYALLFPDRSGALTRMAPRGEADYAELVRLLPVITAGPGPKLPDGAAILAEEKKLSNRSSNLILCTSRITREVLDELVSIRQQQRSSALYYILPAGLSRAETEAAVLPLHALDDCGVDYCTVQARPAD